MRQDFMGDSLWTICGYISLIINFSECYNGTNGSYCLWLPDLYWYCLIVILLIIFLLAMQVPWRTGLGDGGSVPYPSSAFSESTLPGCYRWNFLWCHSPKYPKLIWSLHRQNPVRGPVLVILNLIINRSLFPHEDTGNDLSMIWFETETRGLLVEEGFRLITSWRFFPDHSEKHFISQLILFFSK